ncbi:MAG: hypothetical protein ACH36H_12965, partial [Candidatus Nanopelagicales bacterium]
TITGEVTKLTQPETGVGSVLAGAGRAALTGLQDARSGLAIGAADIGGSKEAMAREVRALRQRQLETEMSTPDIQSRTGKAAYSGVVSLAQNLPPLVAGVATGNPEVALAGMVAPMGAAKYAEYRAEGVAPMKALAAAFGQAATEYVTEKIPMGKLIADMGGKVAFGKMLVSNLAREIPGEQVATIVQDAIDQATLHPEKTWKQYLIERPEAAYQTLVATAVQSGLTTGGGALVNKLTGREPAQERAPIQGELEKAASFGSEATRAAGLPDVVVPKGPAPTQVEDKPTVSATLPKMPGQNADQAAQPPVAESLAPAQEAGDAGVAPGQEAARPAPMSNPRAPAADATGVDLASQAPLPSAPNVEPRGVEPSVTTPDGGVTDIVGRQTVQGGPALTTTAAPPAPQAPAPGRSLTGTVQQTDIGNPISPPQAALLKEAPIPGVSQPATRTELPEVEPTSNRPALLDGSYTGDVLSAPEQPFANKSQANLFRDKNQLKGWEAAPIANGWVLRPTSLEPTIGELRHAGQAVTQLQGLQVGGAAPFAGVTLADAMPADTGRAVGVARVAARSLGINLVPVNGLASDGLYVDNQPHAAFVAADSSKPILFVAGHEVYHALKRLGGSVVGDFEQAVSAYLRPEVVANRQAEEEAGALPGQQMQGRGREEVVADVNGAMWLDPKFWREVMLRSPDLFQKVSAAFMEVATKIRAALTRNPAPEAKQFVTDVDAVRKLVAQMTVDARKGAPVKAGDSRKVDS